MDNRGCVLAAFVMGAALGAAFGFLYAPKSGDETRKMLADKACETAEKIGSIRLPIGGKAQKDAE